jgi:hypothetical protein
MNELVKIKSEKVISIQKSEMMSMVDSYIEKLSIEGGNPSEDLVRCAKYIFLLEELQKRLREYSANEVKNHDNQEMDIMGNKVKLIQSSIKYDYSVNKSWVEQKQIVDEASNKLKDIETFTKGLRAKTTIVDEQTGEAYEFYPPPRSSVTSVRVTIK